MKRAWFDAPADVFARLNPVTILGELSLSPFADEPAQKSAWQFEVEHLQPIAAMLPNAHIFLEFGIPRMGRRADAIIVSVSDPKLSWVISVGCA